MKERAFLRLGLNGPTSEFPICPSGKPTDKPDALSKVCPQMRKFGVLNENMALQK